MYAQVTNLSVPIGQMEPLRCLVQTKYLKHVQEREGFVSAYLLEAIDNPQIAQIITFWDSQRALENARSTGSLQQTVQVLASYMPDVSIRRQGNIVTAKTSADTASV